MLSKVSVIRFNFAILEEEARQIRFAYQKGAVSYRKLRRWSTALVNTFEREGYFMDCAGSADPVWVRKKWEETDFLILKNPGRLSERFAEFEIGEERIVPRDWWADNIAAQIEARYLALGLSDAEDTSCVFEPSDDQAVIISRDASPQTLRGIIAWLQEKNKTKGKPVALGLVAPRPSRSN